MNQCWYSRKKRMESNVCCALFLIFAVIIVSFVMSSHVVSIWVLEGWIIGLWLVKASIFYYLVFSSRAYQVTEEGILVRNFKKKILKYSWDEITEISVCDIHHSSGGFYLEKVIRVVIGKEKNGPTNPKCSRSIVNGLERWRKGSYSLRHYRKIILIEYSEERLSHIRNVYKKEVKDYRTKYWNQYKE